MGSGWNDGCMQAPQYALTPGEQGEIWHNDCFAPGGYINQASGTSTDYTTTRPATNVAACDYPVAKWSPDSALADPAIPGAIPGCTYDATGGLNANGVLKCTGSSFLGFSGFNFGPVGGHGCTVLQYLAGTFPNPVTISDSKFLNDGDCSLNSFTRSFIAGNGSSISVNYFSNTFDGNVENYPTVYGACSSTPAGGMGCNISEAVNVDAPELMRYNAFLNFFGSPVVYFNYQLMDMSYNFGMRWNARDPLGHAEFSSPAGATDMSYINFLYNTLIGATGVVGEGTSPLPLGLTFQHTVANVKIDGNTLVTPYVGGMARGITSMTGTLGAETSRFTITSVSPPGSLIGNGLVVSCSPISFALSTPYGGTTSAGIGGGFLGGAGAVFGADLDIGDTPSFTLAGASISGTTLTAPTPGNMVIQIGQSVSGTGVTGSPVITGGSGTTWTISVSQGTIGPETLTIGINNRFDGGWESAANHTCTVSDPNPGTSANTAFSTIGLVVGSTSEIIGNYGDFSSFGGDVNIWAAAAAFCATPTNFASNVDMAGQVSSTVMNRYPPGGTPALGTGYGCALGAPALSSAPTISGTAQVANTLTGTAGTWTNTPTFTSYVWWESNTGTSLATTATPGESIAVASISGTTMTTNNYVTIAAGASITSSAPGFPASITVPGGGTGLSFTISNPGGGSYGPAAATASGAVTFSFAAQNFPLPSGYITTLGFTGGAAVYNFSTPQQVSSISNTSYVIISSANDGVQTGGNLILPAAISGATTSTYSPVAGDVGNDLYLVVYTSNTLGQSREEVSALAGPVIAQTIPVNVTLPVISGTPEVSQTLTVAQGTWTQFPTSIIDTWYSGGVSTGVTGPSYGPVTGDITKTITVEETATNAAGSSSPAISAGVGPVVAAPFAVCTGGIHSTDGAGNSVITFDASGTLNCSISFTAEILVVGGGGGASGGGGGAGGDCTTEGTPTCGLGATVTIPSGSTTVTIGAGGAGTAPNGAAASQGGSSSLGSIVTALGGGGGGPQNVTPAPSTSNGGSGGGAGANGGTSGGLAGGTGSQGHNGGSTPRLSTPFAASGGGGAGAAGSAAVSAAVAGAGGNGLSNSITGSAVFYAGGGGGGFDVSSGATGYGAGGTGGGGAGNSSGGVAGTPNTGGGGGASEGSTVSASGGSGVVIISCPTSVCN